MGLMGSVSIDAEIETVGQFDRLERWKGPLQVERIEDGKVRIGQPTQSGFGGIVVAWDDLLDAVDALDVAGWVDRGTR